MLYYQITGSQHWLHYKWSFCRLYHVADDLILISAIVNGLQTMLNCCYNASINLLLKFNSAKSSCFAIGKGHAFNISNMQLGNDSICGLFGRNRTYNGRDTEIFVNCDRDLHFQGQMIDIFCCWPQLHHCGQNLVITGPRIAEI